MATNANYARLGLFVVLASALIVGAVMWFGGAGAHKHEFLVETYFVDPVSGLDVGSAVNFRGVKVGAVKRISFIAAEYPKAAPEDRQTIWVLMALDRRLIGLSDGNVEGHVNEMLAKGIHATVSASGVTGLSRIEMNYPKTKIQDKKISWRPKNVCVPPAPSILQSAADSAQRILGQIDRMDLVDAWTNLIFTIKSAGATIEGAGGMLDAQRGNVNEILSNLREASASLRVFADEVRSNPALLLRDRSPEPLDETR